MTIFNSRSPIASARALESMGTRVKRRLRWCRRAEGESSVGVSRERPRNLAAAPDVSLKSLRNKNVGQEIMSSSARKQGKRRADEYRTERFKKQAEV